MVVPIPQKIVDDRLKDGSVDYLFELCASEENREKRKTGRKIDPSTKLVYHPEFNPIPTDIKGFADKLIDVPVGEGEEADRSVKNIKEFYKVFGDEKEKIQAFQEINSNEPLEESFENIINCIKKRLLSKYSVLEEKKH